MQIALITPAAARSRQGNRNTALRWARMLRELGHRVSVQVTWSGRHADLMLALHARRSHPSIRRFAAACPGKPLLVALTGTDLYRDILTDADAQESLRLATGLIVLQEAGLAAVPPAFRHKTRVVYQSAAPLQRQPPRKSCFEVCVIGHLRDEKDPFRCALATRWLPPHSRIRVMHAGQALEPVYAAEAASLMAQLPRYRWRGELPHWQVRRLLARSRVMVISSKMEGGANVVSEALAAGVPVIASNVSGNIGMLGHDYAGYYPQGDEKALAALLARCEEDNEFYSLLERQCGARRWLTEWPREREALDQALQAAQRGRG